MSLTDNIQKDITAAMRGRQEQRLSTLRMAKAALKNKEVEKMGPLSDAEALQVLATLIKQRKDSIEQFTKGGRPELAQKEAAEIAVIEAYMPQAASEEEVRETVCATVTEMGTPTPRDMGAVMKNVMAKFQASGTRVEGKTVSEIVKQELSKR
jgi:hypothetical protein